MEYSKKYIDPTLDWSFKKIFLTPGHEDVLKTFLNDVLKDEVAIHTIQSVLAPSKDEEKQKTILFDVFCTSQDGSKFIIEMQKKDEYDLLQRMDFYRSRTIAEQLKSAGRYKDIVPVIVIAVCDFPVMKECFGPEGKESYFQRLILKGHANNLRLKNFPSLFVLLDLPSYRAQGFPHVSELEDWFDLFTCKFHEIDASSMRPALNKALAALEFAKLPEVERAMAEKALDEARVAASELASAIEKGRREGKMEGKMEEKYQMTMNLIKLGLSEESISEVTGLSVEEIRGIVSE